jgi:hypothetical protein
LAWPEATAKHETLENWPKSDGSWGDNRERSIGCNYDPARLVLLLFPLLSCAAGGEPGAKIPDAETVKKQARHKTASKGSCFISNESMLDSQLMLHVLRQQLNCVG